MEDSLARIAVSGVPYAADKLYTYLVPQELRDTLLPGMRVTVPFGRGNRRSEGFVMDVLTGEAGSACKAVCSVLDASPLMSSELLRLARWMKARYFCTYYDAIRTILPSGIWFRYREVYRLQNGIDAAQALALVKPESREAAVLTALLSLGGEAELSALQQVCPDAVSRTLKVLLERNLVQRERVAVRQVSDKSVRMVTLAVSPEEALAAVEAKRKTAPVRYAAIELLCTEGALSSSELCYYTGATMQTLRGLEKSGLVVFSAQEALRVSNYDEVEEGAPIVLSDEQQAAFDGLSRLLDAPEGGVALLHGVTASGKTQVYIRLIQRALAAGKTAMLLVPEIALTPQMLHKFTAYFGNDVAMLHSGLRLTERYDQWKRICRGEVRVVLGTRSAVFAPLKDLGLIIMDEEQETSYQSENPPRYHTRDIAQFRCAEHRALVLLGSATPTIETSYYAREGRYKAFYLHRRYNQKNLPQVLIADMRHEVRAGNESAISSVLREELEKNLSRGEQSILFLNRRGSSRMLLCVECGAVPECPRCSVPLTYHSVNHRLMCHYCGHSEPVMERCPVCGGRMKHIGSGTQRVEEELQSLFPGSGVLRMDADTVGAANGHEALLRKFEEEKIPILLGTQMIAKGLDFEQVTLVGVLAAELSLYLDNFHAAERTFSLLSQVVGRAGRGSRSGRAVIQTYTPENETIRAAAAQDYDTFYQSEIRMRRLRRYPPFADLITFTLSGAREDHVVLAAAALRDGLRAAALREALRPLQLEVLGPAGAPVVKVNNRYRYRVYIVGKNCSELRRLVSEFLFAFHQHRENRGLDIFADCNALE